MEKTKIKRCLSPYSAMESRNSLDKFPFSYSDYNNNSSITKAISEIEFPNLRMIFLYGNNIHSVETLSRIRMPTLCFLGIGHNFINFVNELSKGNWSLEKIYLSKNGNIKEKTKYKNFIHCLHFSVWRKWQLNCTKETISNAVISALQPRFQSI